MEWERTVWWTSKLEKIRFNNLFIYLDFGMCIGEDDGYLKYNNNDSINLIFYFIIKFL